MSLIYRPPERLSVAGEISVPAAPLAPHRALPRAQAAIYALASYAILTWIVAYVAIRLWEPIHVALAQATIACAVWTVLSLRVTQALRSMTFVIGPFGLAAATSALGVCVLSGLGYWLPAIDAGRDALALIAIATFVLCGAWGQLLQHVARIPVRVLVVGGGAPTERLLGDFDREPDANFAVVAVVSDVHDRELDERIAYGGPLASLSEAVRAYEPDLVVVAVPQGRPQVFSQLLTVADAGFKVVGLPEMYESAFGRLPVEDLTSAWFMSVLHAYNRPASRIFKRAFDVVVAVTGIVVVLPLLPFIVAIVKRTPGPLLYRQERLGEHFQTFTMLKFRSMYSDAEVDGTALWAAVNDPRVIPGGRLMRLLRLDELPQLWNVLRGEMSIVGPRPERPEFIEHLEETVPFWDQRHLLKPGITGWAQVRAGYAADAIGTAEKLSYDFWYLRHRSVLLDTVICLKTIPRMITFRGAR